MALIDSFGREITYLRVSVTDRCDYRCTYCMDEKMKFLPRNEVLSLEEIGRLIRIFSILGVNKVRLTGGEPLIRKNITHLIKEVKSLSTIKQIALTSNGSRLISMAPELKNAGISRVNISLDTLDYEQFKGITRVGNLEDVLKGIDYAISCGLDNIRLNAVIMRGKNDKQIIPLVSYAKERNLDLAFIEEMPLGNISHNRKDTYISNTEIKEIIQKEYKINKCSDNSGGPADYWQFNDCNAKIGFISPHSCNFCKACNRVRLTVDGMLILCLGQENSLDLRSLLRGGKTDDFIKEEIKNAVLQKPEKHDFLVQEKPMLFRHMSHTGG